MSLESQFQARLIKRLRRRFKGCFILKNDANYMQGVPDLIILHCNRWAMLEVKASWNSPERPNQGYYIGELHAMSYAAFIFPENEEAVLNELELALTGPPS